jgi:hypothetical protein
MLARTAATHASSEFFADMPADNSPFGIRPTEPSPLDALDQDEGYFDMIMRVRQHRPPERCHMRRLYPLLLIVMMQS